MGIDAKLDKIVVQFAEASDFSEVPLQSGRNSQKKKKLVGIILASKWKRWKRSVEFGLCSIENMFGDGVTLH